jgi:NADPH:quinone reductase-like Zn-dependent oxidoreductase
MTHTRWRYSIADRLYVESIQSTFLNRPDKNFMMSNKGNKGFGYTKTGRLSGTLEPVTNSIPKVGDDEVIIKVKAMALNPVDEQLYVMCLGTFRDVGTHECSAQLTPDYMKKLNVQFNGGKAFVPGADYAGVIHSAGRNSKWKVGQEVHGMTMDISGGK